MEVSVKLKGLDQVKRAMAGLPRRLDRPMLEPGLLEAARMVRDEARARVPVYAGSDPRVVPGTIRRNIQATRVKPDRYTATVIVRVRKFTTQQLLNFKRKELSRRARAAAAGRRVKEMIAPTDPYFWSFVEFGTSKMPARPFMRNAFKARASAGVNAAIMKFGDRVQKEIVKLAQRG